LFYFWLAIKSNASFSNYKNPNMPKLKTRKSASKRVKIKKFCLLRKKAFKSQFVGS